MDIFRPNCQWFGHNEFRPEEAMIPLVAPCGENSVDVTQKRKQAMVQRLAEIGEVDAKYQLPTRVQIIGDSTLVVTWMTGVLPNIQESGSPRPPCAGRSVNVGYERLRRPVPPLLQRVDHTG